MEGPTSQNIFIILFFISCATVAAHINKDGATPVYDAVTGPSYNVEENTARTFNRQEFDLIPSDSFLVDFKTLGLQLKNFLPRFSRELGYGGYYGNYGPNGYGFGSGNSFAGYYPIRTGYRTYNLYPHNYFNAYSRSGLNYIGVGVSNHQFH